jgi:hypothetical protein
MSENTELSNLGTLAYYDTLFAGLVPCIVTGLRVYNEHGHYEVFFTITADRRGYKRGEKLSARSMYVIPRKMVRVKNGHYGIKTGYAWVERDGQVYAIVNR